VSRFGDLVRALRQKQGMTLEAVAKKVGTHKGYISGIERGKVSPPSVKMIRKFARAFGQDEKVLVRLAWVDKAPPLLRREAEDFLRWCQENSSPPAAPERPPSPPG
jgi:transcriptional regulator with XRE-family HTH domain